MALEPTTRPTSIDGTIYRLRNRGFAAVRQSRSQEVKPDQVEKEAEGKAQVSISETASVPDQVKAPEPVRAPAAEPVRSNVVADPSLPENTPIPEVPRQENIPGESTASRTVQFRREVAEDIIKRLEAGTAPWQKPWDPSVGYEGAPRNAISGRAYQGMNSFILQMSSKGEGDPRWMTYKQAEEKGWKVRPGERGTKIEFWQKMTKENGQPAPDGAEPAEAGATEKTYMIHKTYVVFNAAQVDGIPPLEPKPMPPEKERFERAEAVALAVGAEVAESKNGRAYYSQKSDKIMMPPRAAFGEPGGYESVLLHEAAHATGHESRMNRTMINQFGSPDYAREELRAEMTSAILARETGIPHNPDRHASYVESWIQAVKKDPNELFRAAADAQKIAAYMVDRAIERGVQIEPSVYEHRRENEKAGQSQARDAAAPAVKVLGQDVHRWSGRVTDIAEDRTSAVIRASGRDTVIKMPDGQTLPDGVEKGAYGKLAASRDNQPARFVKEEKQIDRSKQRSRGGREIGM